MARFPRALLVLLCAVGLAAACSPSSTRKIAVHVRGRPNGHPCPAARVVSSSHGTILDDAVTDVAGDAVLRVPRSAEYEVTQYHELGRVSVTHLTGGDDVLIPTWCSIVDTKASSVLQLEIDAQRSLDTFSANSSERSYFHHTSVSGTAFSLSLENDETHDRGDLPSYSLFARGTHPDGTSEIGVLFDIPVMATNAAIALHPATPAMMAVSVTGAPTISPAFAVVNLTRGRDILVIYDDVGHPLSPTPDWTTELPVFGQEYATGSVSLVRFPHPSGAFRSISVARSGFDPVTIDASLLPPLVTLHPLLHGSALQWTIAAAGPTTLAVAVLVSPGFDEYYFPASFCDTGECTLVLPPFPTDRKHSADPPVSMGVWYLDSTNVPSSYPASLLSILTRPGDPGIRRASGSPLALSY